jgi:hypothetical protein
LFVFYFCYAIYSHSVVPVHIYELKYIEKQKGRGEEGKRGRGEEGKRGRGEEGKRGRGEEGKKESGKNRNHGRG